MRIARAVALAACGLLAASAPCLAQGEGARVAPSRTLSVPKKQTPQRLSPPSQDIVTTPRLNTVPPPREVTTVPVSKATPSETGPAAASPSPQAAPAEVSAPPAAPLAPMREPLGDSLPDVIVPQPGYAAPPQQSYAPVLDHGDPAPSGPFSTPERLMDWMSNYRKHKAPARVPAAVKAMYEFGLFGDEEKQWFCIGFIAGVLGDNPKDGPRMIPKMFPLPDKEQAVIIRAIAYSGRPDWRQLLEKNSSRMPLRRPLIDDFLKGKRPTLMELPLDDGGSPGVYALWGYYVATGQHEPVIRIMEALKWSKSKKDSGFAWRKIFSGWGRGANTLEKITTGGTAKWTLASYAERDRELINLYRAEASRQPKEIAEPLKEVISAAEDFEAERIRKDQFGAIEDAQRSQLSADAGMTKGATAGSLAIATGCVAATALGQAQIAIPCVIGGALYSGAAKLAR
jgi:hypothetical protein